MYLVHKTGMCLCIGRLTTLHVLLGLLAVCTQIAIHVLGFFTQFRGMQAHRDSLKR